MKEVEIQKFTSKGSRETYKRCGFLKIILKDKKDLEIGQETWIKINCPVERPWELEKA